MNYTTLVSAQTLEQNLDSPDWVIFDCRCSLTDHDVGEKAYREGHIPNALFCDLENDLSSPVTETSGRHPLPEFEQLIQKLGDWGVDKNSQIVVYDDAGGAFAVRMWWQLKAFGHQNIALLDGGISHWLKEDKLLSQEAPTLHPKTFTPNVDTNSWLNSDQIEQNLLEKTYTLIDARTPERFRGEAEPIDKVAGRIPDSLNRPLQINLDENGLFLPADELKSQFKELFKKADIESPKKVVHFCGSGVTACHNLLAMEIAGFTGSKLYPGSWSEWITNSKRPIAMG